MDLLVAILIAIGALTDGAAYDQAYIETNQAAVQRATTILENNWYRECDGGVIVDAGVGE